ncbi:MAG: thioredoxin family protein [Maricaulaceae bacterium]
MPYALPPYDLPPYPNMMAPPPQSAKIYAGGDPHHDLGDPHPPELKAYDASRNARADVLAALSKARSLGKKTIIVMGANWCHDSRILAGRFAQPHFQTLLEPNYEVVYVDAGKKDRNLDIAQDFGVLTIEGTPTIFVVGPDGRWLNSQTATTWRDAGSRTDEAIYMEFAQLAQL